MLFLFRRFRNNIIVCLILTLDIFCSVSLAQVVIPFSYWKSLCKNNISNLDNNVTTGFGAGTTTNVTWSGTALQLSAGQVSGTYVSPAFSFSDCYNTSWSYLNWTTTVPFGKEIPTTNETSTNYSAIVGGLATNLVGLWHLNETSGTTFADSSGTGNTGTKQGTITLGISGILFNAATFDGSTGYISTPNTFNTPNIFTVSIWFKTATTVGGRMIGLGNAATGSSGNYDRHLYMDNSGKINFGVYPTMVALVTSTLTYNDNKWHQAVGTLSAAGLKLYMDGTLDTSDPSTTTAQNYTGYIRIGYDNNSGWTNQPTSFFFGGTLDEAAFWTRALSATEVQQIYQRGGNRIKFQVRQCTQANCSDNPAWQGPDGTAATYFTEVNNNSNQNLATGTVQTTSAKLIFSNFPGLILKNSQAFQYQIIFQTDKAAYSPDVKTVTISH